MRYDKSYTFIFAIGYSCGFLLSSSFPSGYLFCYIHFFSGKILHREKERNYFFINFFDDVYFEVVFLRCLKDSAFT